MDISVENVFESWCFKTSPRGSCKSHKLVHLLVLFNDIPVKNCYIQKHFDVHLDQKLNFNHHVKEKITKANKSIRVIKKSSNTLLRDVLLTIYKLFVRAHLDHGNIIYDQPQNKSFCNKLESVRYNAALAITEAIRVTPKIKLYKELSLEILESRRWFKRLCTFYKMKIYKVPPYLAQLLPKGTHLHNTRKSQDITTFQSRTETFEFSVFPWSIVD